MASNQLELSTLKCIFVPNFVVSYRLEQLGQNRAVNLLRTIAPGDDARLQPGTMCVQYMGGGGGYSQTSYGMGPDYYLSKILIFVTAHEKNKPFFLIKIGKVSVRFII